MILRKTINSGIPNKNKPTPKSNTYKPEPAAAIRVYVTDKRATAAQPFALRQDRLNSAKADNP